MMTTKEINTRKINQLKKPYSLRRLKSTDRTNITPDIPKNTPKMLNSNSKTLSWYNLNNEDENSDSNEDEENIEYIDGIAIYSFTNMRKLKNFHAQNQLKLAQKKSLKAKEESEMNDKYLKKLDDNLISIGKCPKPGLDTIIKHEDIVWQPNISKKKPITEKSNIVSSLNNQEIQGLPECGIAHCKLGCICDTLYNDDNSNNDNDSISKNYQNNREIYQNNKLERDHCGRIECMFVCSCIRKLRSTGGGAGDKKNESNKKNKGQDSDKIDGKIIHQNRRISKRTTKSAASTSMCNDIKKMSDINKSKVITNKNGKSKSILMNSNMILDKSNYELSNISSSEESLLPENNQKPDSDQNLSSDEADLNNNLNTKLSLETTLTGGEDENITTRKSKRVKILNKKFSHENENGPESSHFNDFLYYSTNKAHNKQIKSKILNNRLNENNFANSSYSLSKCPSLPFSPKKEKSIKNKQKQNKVIDPKNVQIEKLIDGNSEECNIGESITEESFRPYIKTFSIKITNKKNQESILNNSKKYSLEVQVYSPIWEASTHLRTQVLRQIARIIQNNVNSGWKELDFDFECLSIQLFNESPILVKINKKIEENSENNRNIMSMNDLLTTSHKINKKLFGPYQNSLIESSNQDNNKIQPIYNNSNSNDLYNEFQHQNPSELYIKPTYKSLPRLITRNRSDKKIENNKTGILLKQVDTLFEKIALKSSNASTPEKNSNIRNSNDMSKYMSISKNVSNLRPKHIGLKQNLFKDEKDYFIKEPIGAEYPFYNPFSDIENVTNMYNKHDSRNLVDTVCFMVNDMITACCKSEEKTISDFSKSGNNKMLEQNNPISKSFFVEPTKYKSIKANDNKDSEQMKVNVINKFPVTLTAIKKINQSENPVIKQNKTIHTFTPSVTNTTSGSFTETIKISQNNSNFQQNISNPPKKGLVYQIISSSEINKKQSLINIMKNGQNNRPSSVVYTPKNQAVSSPKISTFKFEPFESLGSLNEISYCDNIVKRPSTPQNLEKDEVQITGIKTIMPTTTANLKYKTLVRIVTPEKNNPEGGPKIKISSNYMMPAHSCIPGIIQKNTTSPPIITAPKLVIIPINNNENRKLVIPSKLTPSSSKLQGSNNGLSSFVPIRPKGVSTNMSNPVLYSKDMINGYLKSIVCSTPNPNENDLRNKAENKEKNWRINDTVFPTYDSKESPEPIRYQKIPKNNAVITMVEKSNLNKKLTNFVKLENIENKDEVIEYTDNEDEMNKLNYIQIRKRKRKQDLSYLKNQHSNVFANSYSNNKDMEDTEVIRSNEIALRENYKNMNQFDDNLNYMDYKLPITTSTQSNTFIKRFDPNNSAFKVQSTGPSILHKNRRKREINSNSFQNYQNMNKKICYSNTQGSQNMIHKNLSSSPDSQESIYSASTPLPFDSNTYDNISQNKPALLQYKEYSDEEYTGVDYPTDFNINNQIIQEIQYDNDIIEIDSENNSNEQIQGYGTSNSNFMDQYPSDLFSNNQNVIDDQYQDFAKQYKKSMIEINEDSDSESDSMENSSFLNGKNSSEGKDGGPHSATCNNIHSIRERQRRLKLKNLLMKLKIQLFEAESESKYILDDSVSQMRLDEYCNTRNFNKKNLRSKQNILQEAVYLIKNLQNQQILLDKVLKEKQMEFEKNIELRNYLKLKSNNNI